MRPLGLTTCSWQDLAGGTAAGEPQTGDAPVSHSPRWAHLNSELRRGARGSSEGARAACMPPTAPQDQPSAQTGGATEPPPEEGSARPRRP